MMPKKVLLQPQWRKEPEKPDYSAAETYLSLIYSAARSAKFVATMRNAKCVEFAAKDIFRASGLPMIGLSNSHVRKDQKRIAGGKPISPLLLVRDRANGKVVIADGYHRLCAVYTFDEDARLPCKIV
jgi:hypothetical protein